MSYDPTQPTPKDVIRAIVADTATAELMTDAEYEAAITRHDPSFTGAVSEIAYALAVKLDNKITSMGANGKVDLGWAARATTLREIGKRYAKLADAEDAASVNGSQVGKTVTVNLNYLTPDPYDLGAY